MTKLTKKVFTWLFSVFAFIALALGFAFDRPQIKTASAETVEVTWADSFGLQSMDGGYQRYLIRTPAVAWTSYNNESYADNYLAYTKLNGRTVKEINEAAAANGSTQKIWACLQPADGFSFYSVCVPNTFEELPPSDIRSFSIEPGWTHVDSSTSTTYPGTGNTYTNSATVRWHDRDGAFKQNTGTYADINAAANFTFSSQGDQGDGSTCFILNTKAVSGLWTAYGSAMKVGNPVLNEIYINGKSIKDWNIEAQAAVDKGEAADMLYGSTNAQNTTAGGPIAVLPGYSDSAAHGAFFQIYIANNFLPASSVYSVEFKPGFSFMRTGSRELYYMSSGVRFDSLGDGWRQVTNFIDLDGGDIIVQNQGTGDYAGVNCFLIGFGAHENIAPYFCLNDNYAKTSPLTGASYGENLDYITINGKTIGQIKAENPNYDYTTSNHPNIKNGGSYAPIFVHMSSADIGRGTENYIQVYIPTDLIDPSTVTEIGLKTRLFNYVKDDTTKYGLTEDVTFVKMNGAWVDTRSLVNSSNTTISEAQVDGSNGELYRVDITSSIWNSTRDQYDYNYGAFVSLRQNLFINGVSVHTINTTVDDSAYVYSTYPMTLANTYEYGGETYDLFANPVLMVGKGDTLSLYIHKDYFNSLNGSITLSIGESFSYLDTKMQAAMSKVIFEGETPTYTVTVDGIAQTVEEGGYAEKPANPTKAEDENYTYTFDNWYIVNTSTVFDFSTAITQDYNVESRFTATPKAKAEEVSWNAVVNFEPNIDGSAYTRIRLNTPALAWTVSLNHTTADQYLAYTKLNGRTVKEINEAAAESGSALKITVCLQPAGSFSFYGVYIPNAFTEILAEDVYTVTMEAGWQHEDSKTGTTYTNNTTKTWYFRDSAFYEASGFKEIDAATTTFGSQGVVMVDDETTNTKKSTNTTCFIFSTLELENLWTAYAATMKVGNPVLNHIYINGKSIKEWNTEALAAVASGEASDKLYGSTHGQNSTAGGPIAVLPGYSTNVKHGAFFQIFIANNFLSEADIYSFEWKEEFSFMHTNNNVVYSISEGVKFEKMDGAWVNTNDIYTVTVQDYDGEVLDTQRVVSGKYATAVENPSRPMTPTAIYTFTGWKDSEGNAFNFASTPITGDITVIAQYEKHEVSMIETTVLSIQFQFTSTGDNWMIFTLSNHDYTCDTGKTDYNVSYEELQRIGFLDNVVVKGDLVLGSESVEEATLAQLFAKNGEGEGRFINFWGKGTFGVRIRNTPAYDSITEIVVKSGINFPSYEYACNANTSDDVRYTVYREQVFVSGTSTSNVNSDGKTTWTTIFGVTSTGYDIVMADGAAIRLASLDNYDGSQNYMETEGYKQSGIRFQTMISLKSIAQLQEHLGTIYESVSFGTLIVPSADIVGGDFSIEWLKANGITYMDIESTAWLTADDYRFASEEDEYVSFFGSIVNLKVENHSRYFSGIGYIKVIKVGDAEPTYFYAPTNASCSRSATYIAQAAVADRSTTQTDYYANKIDENNNWSPYTEGEITFLKLYMGTLAETEATAETFTLTSTGALASVANSRNVGTVNVNKKLSGAYVRLNYQTNIDVWGKFYYQNEAGTASAVEDFYLPKGSSEHKQYLDLFRKNGVGKLAGLTAGDLYLTKITFQNATVDKASSGTFKFLGLYSSAKTLDTANLQLYVTKGLDAGGDMTVGAHLGLGGALTYLAKSGIYEGVTSILNGRNILIRNNTSEFASTYSGDSGYYGHATSSKPDDGAVNLINNYDAGRQIQQSWYANVGGSLSSSTGANGYTRLSCSTGDGGYWPYNPVQAGDCNSNPGQIIDYEVNEEKGYIYVKARAMDWAYGDTSKGGYTNGSTTKSYMENYYRLNSDGTLYVNNSFVDWNGFTDMGTCDFCLVELPAFYPIQSLNHFFTYDGASPWTGGSLTHKDDLSGWTSGGNSHYQSTFDKSAEGSTGEEWVAWGNDANGSIAFGMYIPNVTRFTSGRTNTSITAYTTVNVNAISDNLLKSKGLMSNMQPISYKYQSCYVQNTSYTAPGIDFKMEAYTPIDYTYVLSVNDIATMRSQFKAIHDSGKVTNAGRNPGDKVGLDAWARADKIWTQF